MKGSLSNQQGAVLFTALMLLVIMTLLGISTMTSTNFEEKMAGNSQDINRSFQAAESGLAMVKNDSLAFDTRNLKELDGGTQDIYTPSAITNFGQTNSGIDISYNSYLLQKTPPTRDSGWDTSVAFYYFDLSATATTKAGTKTSLHQGVYQVGPK